MFLTSSVTSRSAQIYRRSPQTTAANFFCFNLQKTKKTKNKQKTKPPCLGVCGEREHQGSVSLFWFFVALSLCICCGWSATRRKRMCSVCMFLVPGRL